MSAGETQPKQTSQQDSSNGRAAAAPGADSGLVGSGRARPDRGEVGAAGRYRRLPTGVHGLDPEEVRRDQRERLQAALVELIAERGYKAVRILDLTKLARVSRPTFYSLYADKEELFLAAYDEIAQRTAQTILAAYGAQGSPGERLRRAIRAFAELAAAEPEAMSLMVLGAFGAGPKALERRNRTLSALEQSIQANRAGADRSDAVRPDADAGGARGASATKALARGAARSGNARNETKAAKEAGESDLMVKVILGGIREVTAARLRRGQARELPGLADELATWAESYPAKLPAGLAIGGTGARREQPKPADGPSAADGLAAAEGRARTLASARARQAEGRLPSGRHDLPRPFIVKNQRERIVDATAAIVAEKGLQSLTIPEIARRANVSHQTFYEMYPTKDDAFLGAQKVGLHQALGVAVQAYEAHGDDWSLGVATGIRALLDYLASEPAHAHLTVVDTFAASPTAIEIRDTGLHAFAAYLQPGYHHAPAKRRVPGIAPEAIAGGIWQALHDQIDDERVEDIAELAPQMVYFALTPFIGSKAAAQVARRREVRSPS